MDIIVTTPKSQIAAAAREAADVLAAGGGEYFRHFPLRQRPRRFSRGERVFYVEDGFLRGFATAAHLMLVGDYQVCETSGRRWGPGFYVFMDATTWRWIRPLPMRGFRGFRYAETSRPDVDRIAIHRGPDHVAAPIDVVGGWRDPRPAAEAT